MKGIMFNLLEEVVIQERGEAAWDEVLDDAGADGAYTSLGSYPDSELLKLLAAANPDRASPGSDLRWFGRAAMPLLSRRYPDFFIRHGSTRSFLLTLNEIIHTEVRKIYPGSDVPHFDFDSLSASDQLVLRYQSKRRLCGLAEGLIEGAADYFSERVSIAQTLCMHRGDDKCILVCRFSQPLK
jgi:Haem-NO-binding